MLASRKNRYIYYHCTGNRGRCDEPYVRQERLEAEFSRGLRPLVIPPGRLSWLCTAAADSDRTQQATGGGGSALVNCGFSGTNRTALAPNTPKRQLQTSRVA